MSNSQALANCDNERILVKAAKAGDSEAFGLLYLENQSYVRHVCMGILRNPERAEDMVQEVFLLAWRKLGYFRGTCRFRTWLHRIAFNRSCMELRRSARCDSKEMPLDDFVPMLGYQLNPDVDGQVRLALASLNDLDREIVVLFHIEGRSVREVAKLEGLSTPALKARLYRARVKMREAIT